MKRRLWNVVIYGAMVLTACAVNQDVKSSVAEETVAAASTAEQAALEPGTKQEDRTGGEEAAGSVQADPEAGETESAERIYDIEEAVSYAILHRNADAYMLGECSAEGHHILETEEAGDQVTVYVLAMFGYYGFEDGNFIKVSGSGAIPTVITFRKHPDGSYGLLDHQEAMDGGMYLESIKELFPERLQESCLHVSETIMEDLRAQEHQYAADYLEAIGREAEIGEFGDYDHKILTDLGVSVEVSNQMAEYKELGAYPFWLGNREQIEDGVRYLYEKAYRMDLEEIRYTKYVYGTEEIVEQHIFDALTGEQK